jgi:hypothetical protein
VKTTAKPLRIFCNNQSAIAVSKNPTAHVKTKHIAIKFHWIREKVNSGEIAVEYITTEQNGADMFTKPLPAAKFLWCVKDIGMLEL